MKSDICNVCGEKKPGNISTHGICEKCSWERQRESVKQIKRKSGPLYEKWKAGLKRAWNE